MAFSYASDVAYADDLPYGPVIVPDVQSGSVRFAPALAPRVQLDCSAPGERVTAS